MDLQFTTILPLIGPMLFACLKTVFIGLISCGLGLAIGTLLLLLRNTGIWLFRQFVVAYGSFIRGTPALAQILVFYYALPPLIGINIGPFTAGIMAIGFNSGAYVAEILRGGIDSVSKGQFEAAKALGLKYGFYMRRIILPQIYRYVIPPGTNIALTMVKESSLLSMITVAELTFAAHDINGRTFTPVETYTTIAFLYWAVSMILLRFAEFLHAKHSPMQVHAPFSLR